MTQITILTENLVRQRGLLAEHGLSLWIETEGVCLLFDTGSTDVYARNAASLGIDLDKTQAIVISHGHYDHAGGLQSFPENARWPRCFLHPDAFKAKYAAGQPDRRSIGIPWQLTDLQGLDHRLMLNRSTMQIGSSLTICADIPDSPGGETMNPAMLAEQDGQLVTDPFGDEQLLVINTVKGLIVVLGCCHRGLLNSLRHVQSLFPLQSIHAVIGGMHLEHATPDRVEKSINLLRELDVQVIVPLHCTGQAVIAIMQNELGDRVLRRCTGETLELP